MKWSGKIYLNVKKKMLISQQLEGKSVFQMLSIFAYAESLEFSYLFHNEQFVKLSLLF